MFITSSTCVICLFCLTISCLLTVSSSTYCHGVQPGDCELRHHHHLICVGSSPTLSNIDANNVTSTVLCDWPLKTFEVLSELGPLDRLEHFTLSHGDVTVFNSSFTHFKRLLTVTLTKLRLRHIGPDVFADLPLLQSVDLRHNHLSLLDSHVFRSASSLHSLYLLGNNWTCDPRLLWILSDKEKSLGSKVRDKQELFCEGKTKATPKPLLQVMQFIEVMQKQCPVPCNCSVDHVVRAYSYLVQEKGKLLPHIRVNCNRRNLTTMPGHLPDYTTALFLRGNNLTSVEAIVFNKHYQDVREIYLDNNKISSVNILEGSYWLKNFGVLNLQGNQLRQIPLYALDHAFQSQKLSHIFLGRNPWRCDCKFTTHFRDFLKKYSSIIKDLEDIRCETIQGDTNSGKRIINLNMLDLCKSGETMNLSTLDKLNIFLACMIFLNISTFLYNLTVYKTTGRLPWIVAKLF